MTAVFRALRPDEREECLDLWLRVWPGYANRTYFERYFYGDVGWLPYYTQVAECDGRLVSTVHICNRTVACGEFRLNMGGIANVATLPEYRGRGYNTGCLKNAIEVMEADAMDFALLFTGINAYYRKFGFANLPRGRTSVRIRPDFKRPLSRFTIRPAASRDIYALRRIYSAYNHDRPIAVQRSEAYWRDWMRFDPRNLPSGLMVATVGSGDIAGYVCTGGFSSAAPYDSDDSSVRVIELCIDTKLEYQEEEVTRSLLNEVIVGLLCSGTRKLVLEIANTPAVLAVLADAAELRGIEHTIMSSSMVRLLHHDNLLKSVCMCASERWRNAGSPAGKLTFETPYGRAVLDATGTLPRMADAAVDSAQLDAPISQSDLFSLLFGTVDSHLAPYSVQSQLLMSALFPKCDMVYWGADGF